MNVTPDDESRIRTPTVVDFQRECEVLEGLITCIKRKRDLESLSVDELVDEYLLVHAQYMALDGYMHGGSRAIWGHGFEGSKKVHRRANRQRNLTADYVWDIKDLLISRGQPGIEGIKRMFLSGDKLLAIRFCNEAAAYFPDDAERVFEQLLQLPDGDPVVWFPHRERLKDLLIKIRGYRERSASALAPTISDGEDVRLAPTLKPVEGSPADYQEMLLEQFAINVFTGTMNFKEAVIDAWRWVTEVKRLAPAEVERAELATFDFEIREQLEKEVIDRLVFQPGSRFSVTNIVQGLAYAKEDGSPVTLEEMGEALSQVVWMSRNVPWHVSATWQRVR